MSLDIYLLPQPCPHCGGTEDGWSGNITHNLTAMASAAGLYYAIWRPDEYQHGCRARNLIPDVEEGLKWLHENEDEARKHEPKNKWGSYDGLIDFVQDYLSALHRFPDADVEVSR